ncbi:thiamine ABC transporter substrate binding subunit [Psychromarinibacter halotolerans]|uniref:Thiamine-binding periplasmic protein n=1 Tax=Psychromarinibacter halotolerans TaxID=1775175 RepID=A0ABV7GNP1_9RHOB|nr:thiamine ABC transporter substrate binding subunit [Psychromarinibacter halotolerans]MDF0595693.1 thiamine ABC transporter substrate binding subunit [Psychromarinibacter halotolerans]
MRFPTIAALAVLAHPAVAQDTPVLRVLTYDSFVTEWGPGPQIEAAFEETCGCDLQLIASGDGASLLARLKLEGDRSDADVILGLDTNLTADAAATGLFAEHGVATDALDLPVAWDDPLFLPYDWGYFAFVYDTTRLDSPPASLRALADSDLTVIIQDPRTSTPGLGLLMWAEAAFGDAAEAWWEDLSANILTVTAGWSEAYGLFLDGEADMVLSYTTSPAYHVIAEGDDTKAAAPFEEGHYLQVEVAGKLANTDQPELADAFLAFMLSEGFQSVIPETNWMYPAVLPEGGLADGFDGLVTPDTALLYPADEADAVREAAMQKWLAALAR